MELRSDLDLSGQGNEMEELSSGVEILGCNVSKVTLSEALSQIEKWIQRPIYRPRYIVATGFHGLWEAQKDHEFRKVLNSADLFCPDGIAPVWLSRLNGEALPGRVSGPDILSSFLNKADKLGYSSFFFGDTEETLTALKAKLATIYPGHRTVGALSPPFRQATLEEDMAIIDEINSARPDILWVGLGMPKQDWWIHNHLSRLKVPIVIGIGAGFRFLSGGVKRAPAWIGNNGFEWLWRLAAEPRKLWRRDLIDGPQFLAYAFVQFLRAKRAARSPGHLPALTMRADISRLRAESPISNKELAIDSAGASFPARVKADEDRLIVDRKQKAEQRVD